MPVLCATWLIRSTDFDLLEFHAGSITMDGGLGFIRQADPAGDPQQVLTRRAWMAGTMGERLARQCEIDEAMMAGGWRLSWAAYGTGSHQWARATVTSLWRKL